jgi:hypothetical protein
MAGFFALTYFGAGDRQRGDLVGSLVQAAGLAALVMALTSPWVAAIAPLVAHRPR